MGGSISASRRELPDGDVVEKRLVKALQQRAAAAKSSVKSFDAILMKFSKIDMAFDQVRDVFKRFASVGWILVADKHKRGTIDLEQLKACFRELKVEFTEEEVQIFYEEGDVDHNRRISFKEFIVVLALAYLLGEPLNSDGKSRIGLPDLEWSFETIEDAFVFFDKNGDGYVTKEEMIESIHESSHATNTQQDSIGVERFEEMDWDRDGRVTFKEFLLAFTGWVGIEDDEDQED
ncbi:hypothetical protein SELMODRAFT_425580 [Selaginella moellendorffii]|uniref:EF-hand domain-containing protein n=1 Tax=Selaginella moellendorffii TaxID=88036 RepID=D8STK3_SELML|nr:hypothetical protein SELMODRAFT_425580 [Selaginella moellendorffii]